MNKPLDASVAPEEIARFSAQSGAWWDPFGPFRSLHELAPLRIRYICQQLAAAGLIADAEGSLKGLKILDLGCGGGLIAEALAERGASVTGVDASAEALAAARAHAAPSGLRIDYREGTAEALAASAEASFDAVIAFEIVEHVRDLPAFMNAACRLIKPDGLILIATLNRTHASYLLGVVAAEYLLGWVAAGTHDWDKFVRPAEIESLWRGQGVEPVDVTGMVYKLLKRAFEMEKGRVSVNYFMTGRKKHG